MLLVSTLLLISVLGMGVVVRVHLTPAHNPIPIVSFVLSSILAAAASDLVNLANAVIMAISIGADLFMTPTYAPLDVPPGLS